MRFKFACTVFLSVIFFCFRVSGMEYSGNNLLAVLGKDKNCGEFRQFSDWWELNGQGENKLRGIKVYVNEGTQKVEGILFAGENFTLNSSRFYRCTSLLPF